MNTNLLFNKKFTTYLILQNARSTKLEIYSYHIKILQRALPIQAFYKLLWHHTCTNTNHLTFKINYSHLKTDPCERQIETLDDGKYALK